MRVGCEPDPAARARIRHESWHLLHLYAYLGTGLALPHQLWTGGDFLASPAATLYWWSPWGAAAGAVLLFRVGLPLWRSARHGLVVDRVVTETPGVISVHVTGRDLHRLPATRGVTVWYVSGRRPARGAAGRCPFRARAPGAVRVLTPPSPYERFTDASHHRRPAGHAVLAGAAVLLPHQPRRPGGRHHGEHRPAGRAHRVTVHVRAHRRDAVLHDAGRGDVRRQRGGHPLGRRPGPDHGRRREDHRAQAIQYPNGNGRDREINDYALPILGNEVLSQQSASIDAVSGATVTSGGYISSLQSAIDAAHL